MGSVCLDWQKEIEAARRGGSHLDEGLHLDGGDRDLAIALCAVHITDADAAAVNETLDDEGVANGDALRAHAREGSRLGLEVTRLTRLHGPRRKPASLRSRNRHRERWSAGSSRGRTRPRRTRSTERPNTHTWSSAHVGGGSR